MMMKHAMMTSATLISLVAPAAACAPDAPAGNNAIAAVPSNTTTVTTEAAPAPVLSPANAAVKKPGTLYPKGAVAGKWQFESGAFPTAFFGPEDSYVVARLECSGTKLLVALGSVGDRPGMSPATLESGGARVSAPTKIEGDPIPDLEFSVPLNSPAVSNMAAHGFTITFPNGDRNPIPGGAAIDRLIKACQTAANTANGAHSFAGKFVLVPQSDNETLEITALGGQRYKVELSWFVGKLNGGTQFGGWEGTAEANGNALTINRDGGNENPTLCSLTYSKDAKLPYRMKDCGAGDGAYRRAR